MTTNELINRLREAAAEIATEGHNGWGNLCSTAADELESLSAERDQARADLAYNRLSLKAVLQDERP